MTKHAVGDRVGVGCMVDSCRECAPCLAGEEQYCLRGNTGTYGSTGKDGRPTDGGYSEKIVVDEAFVLGIPQGISLDVAAPLLCALLLGVTATAVVSPLSSAMLSRAEALDNTYLRTGGGPLALQGGQSVDVQLALRNLFDRHYFVSSHLHVSRWITPGQGRNVALSATYRF